MNAGMQALLVDHLKSLRLSTMIRNLEGHLRQARQEKLDYDEFLLNLADVEVQVRKENGRKRRLREAKFPLLKPLEAFNFEAAGDLDVRLIKELSNKAYAFVLLFPSMLSLLYVNHSINRFAFLLGNSLPKEIIPV